MCGDPVYCEMDGGHSGRSEKYRSSQPIH